MKQCDLWLFPSLNFRISLRTRKNSIALTSSAIFKSCWLFSSASVKLSRKRVAKSFISSTVIKNCIHTPSSGKLSCNWYDNVVLIKTYQVDHKVILFNTDLITNQLQLHSGWLRHNHFRQSVSSWLCSFDL